MTNLPIFQNSVRCFFPLAALSAILGPMYLVCVLINQYPFYHPFFNIFEWHAFEMLWGFFLTLVAGFILTAGGHWTGRGPLNGKPLAALLLIWLVSKATMYLPLPNFAYMFFAALFPIATIYFLRKLLNGYRQATLFTFMISVMAVSKLTYLWGALNGSQALKEFSVRFFLWVILLLVTIIAGRIIPRFTKNIFKLKEDLDVPNFLTYAVLGSVAACFLWTIPHGYDWLNAIPLASAGAFSLVRAGYYRPFMAIKKPIIGTLHVGYILMSFALIYMAQMQIYPAFDVGRASMHLFVTGGVSLIAINVMVRASLGHTGREIKLTPDVAVMFACIVIGALMRTFVPVFSPRLYYPSLHISMGFWTLGFLIYFIRFLPVMFMERIDKAEA